MAQREAKAHALQAAAAAAATPPPPPSRDEYMKKLHTMRHNPAYTYQTTPGGFERGQP